MNLTPNLLSIPSVSFIIPVYNGEKTILKAIQSALNQNYKNFDVIVVNDGSRDNTLGVLNSISDPRLKIIDLKKNQGRSNARNTGVENSKSEFVAFLDADDSIVSNKLSLQMDYITKNHLDLCGTWGTAKRDGLEIIYKQPVENEVIKNRIIKSHTFIHSTVVLKRDIFLNSGGYDKTLNFSEDYDLFLKIVPKIRSGNLPISTVTYSLPHGLKYAIKEQFAISKIRLRAILNYGYGIKNLIYVFTPLISLFIPRSFKLFIKKIIN